MLLPSALDCAPGVQPMRSIYTTNRMLSPPPSHHQCAPSSANIFNTCRALQSLITTNLTSPQPIAQTSCAPPSLASPIVLAPANGSYTKRSGLAPRSYTATNAPQPQTLPPASRKRRRSEISDDNSPTLQQDHNPTAPSTPKRQRLCPPTLPLGLLRTDFNLLQEQAASVPIPSTPQAPLRRRRQLNARSDRPSASPIPSADASEEDWHSPDSSALVSLILHKLRLRQSDWDDCACQLGEGNNSIGERFKILLGNAEVGLRRGGGKKCRRSITEMGFGPPLTGI